jgi:hypothetical protein
VSDANRVVVPGPVEPGAREPIATAKASWNCDGSSDAVPISVPVDGSVVEPFAYRVASNVGFGADVNVLPLHVPVPAMV